MYEDYEIKISHDNLAKVIAALPSPVCLVGGWAVYYTVNNKYTVDTGTEYQGSKDIDLGFHIEGDETNELLSKSDLAKAVESLKKIGYRSIGVRLFKDYHRETHLPLSEAKSKKTPSYNIFQLYVDILVDNMSSGLKNVTGLTPFDEKLLTYVFNKNMFNAIDGFSTRVILPTPPVLLAMKIKSLPARTKDHKKYKDIVDVYALIWYSGISTKKLRQDVSNLISGQDMDKMLSSITKSDYAEAADAFGMNKRKLESAIKDFVHTPVLASKKGKWPIPSNMSYNRLMMTVKGLSVSEGEQKAVDVDVLSKKIGVGIDTVKRGISFLDSIGVINRSSRNAYSLTPVGKLYAEAHLNENAEQIMKVTLDIINQSHLVELADAIKINKNITRKDLYMRIKAFGSYPDGKAIGNMHGPTSTGATTVLRIFEDAGLLDKGGSDKEIDDGRHATDGASGPYGGPRPKPDDGKGNHQVQASPLEEAPANAADGMNDQAVVALRGVGQVRVNDLETLRVAEMYMDMLRKKLS